MPLEIEGAIRYRCFIAGGVKYGIEFHASESAGFANLQERIYRYVMGKHARDVGRRARRGA